MTEKRRGLRTVVSPAATAGRGRARGPARPLTEAEQLRQQCWSVAGLVSLLSLGVLAWCLPRNMLLLYGDAVAHINIARRVFDSLNPGFRQLGSVWLPLPHLLLLPLVRNMQLWQTGLGGAPPSMLAYVLGTVGMYRLGRFWLPPLPSLLGAAFFALNPSLAYLQVTAMTEPLFLCEMVWVAILVVALGRRYADPATPAGTKPERSLLLALGLALFAAVFTRYDGWVYAALAWALTAWAALRAPGGLRRASGGAFVAMTAWTVSAPLGWLCYNARQFHDPLDFLRGPYSARAIEQRTTPPGAGHYPGWHNWHMAGHYFLKCAELCCARPLCGNLLLLLSLLGVFVAWQRAGARAVFALFWLPLAFYAYSVAYGAVPIFIPPWEPHAFYNTRYGLELLPAFALGCAFALHGAQQRWPQWHMPVTGGAFALLVVNAALVLRGGPLVYGEAAANSRTRIPFEQALAHALETLPPYGRILMYTSDHVGALQVAGIPLRRTINDGDWLLWQRALTNPAAAAPFAVALDGDPLAQAIAKHPGGLTTLDVVCTTGQPCARLYIASALLGGEQTR